MKKRYYKLDTFWSHAVAVSDAARALHKTRQRIDKDGLANDTVWNSVERGENKVLRAVEKLAELPRRSLGVKDSR